MRTPPDDRARLRHMLDAARQAHAFVRERTELPAHEKSTYSLVYLLQVVGEAAARLTPETRAAMPAVRWPVIIGMHNRLVHEYYDVNLGVIRDTAVTNLPPLVAELERHLAGDA